MYGREGTPPSPTFCVRPSMPTQRSQQVGSVLFGPLAMDDSLIVSRGGGIEGGAYERAVGFVRRWAAFKRRNSGGNSRYCAGLYGPE